MLYFAASLHRAEPVTTYIPLAVQGNQQGEKATETGPTSSPPPGTALGVQQPIGGQRQTSSLHPTIADVSGVCEVLLGAQCPTPTFAQLYHTMPEKPLHREAGTFTPQLLGLAPGALKAGSHIQLSLSLKFQLSHSTV